MYRFFIQTNRFWLTKSSLFQKIPKTVVIQQPKNVLSKIFSQTKNCPSYKILKQLFQYLQTSDILTKQFPFIKNDPRFQQNWMIIHVILIKNRFILENEYFKTISKMEIQKLNYNLMTYFFSEFGEYVNPLIPVRSFAQHYSQSYMKKLQIYQEIEQSNELHFKQLPQKGANQYLTHYGEYLKKTIYENRVKYQDAQLLKMCKYYTAHRKYLQSLEWSDLIDYKIKWGFQGDTKLIQTF